MKYVCYTDGGIAQGRAGTSQARVDKARQEEERVRAEGEGRARRQRKGEAPTMTPKRWCRLSMRVVRS